VSLERTPFAEENPWRALQALLRSLARREILPRFHHVKARLKGDGSLVTEADGAMQRAVEEALRERWPQYALLGEESSCQLQDRALAQAGGCWILDPLDGTTNFAHGFEIFCTSLALAVGGEVVLGLVYDPLHDELFAARRGRGAELGGLSLRLESAPAALDRALALIDFKRLPADVAAALAVNPPYASQRNLGSVALEWCWLAAARADLYLHGGQKLWDYAAGQLIFSEAGGASCTLEGEAVPRLVMTPRSAVAAADSSLLEPWFQWLRGRLGEPT